MDRIYEDAEVRARDLAQLAQIAAGYASCEAFLTEVLDPPDATSGEAAAPLLDEDYPVLSTIYSAKGQEWHLGASAPCCENAKNLRQFSPGYAGSRSITRMVAGTVPLFSSVSTILTWQT